MNKVAECCQALRLQWGLGLSVGSVIVKFYSFSGGIAVKGFPVKRGEVS